MKSIAGAILILAASIYAVSGLLSPRPDPAAVCGVLFTIHVILGLYFLFFAKDKTGQKDDGGK